MKTELIYLYKMLDPTKEPLLSHRFLENLQKLINISHLCATKNAY